MSITPNDARALFDDPELGIRVVQAVDAASAVRAALLDSTLDHADVGDLLESTGAECVALGPDVVVTRGTGSRRPAAWWVHEEKLFLAEIVTAERALWIEVEPTREAIARATLGMAPIEDASEKSFRFFFGLLPAFATDFVNLENRLTIDAFCEGLPLVLGTAAPTDEEEATADPLHVSQFETLRSRSRIAVTALHEVLDQGSLVIGTVEYRPASHENIVAAWNADEHSDWPLDLPLDVVGAVGFSNGSSLERVERWITGEEDGLPAPFALLVGTAIINAPGPAVGAPSDVEALLRRHAKNPDADVRGMVRELARMFDLEALTEELGPEEPKPSVKDALTPEK